MSESNPPPELPILRELPAAEVAAFLRSLAGLPPADHQGVEVGSRPVPGAVDVVSWIAWALAGLYACALPSTGPRGEDEPGRRGPWVPPVRVLMREARRVAVVVAMHRHDGNLTRAATALGTSRRVLRDTLKAAGLYPWGGAAGNEASEDVDASATTTDAANGGK